MKKWIWIVVLLVGCGNGVPDVPDAHHIVIDGKPMPPMAFLKAYCEKEIANPTCIRVQRAMSSDAVLGDAPRF